MQAHLKMLDRPSRTALLTFALMGTVFTFGVARAQQTQILIDDARAFPESLTSTADGTDHPWQFGPRHGLSRRARCREGDAVDRSLNRRPHPCAGRVLAHDASNTLWHVHQ